MSSKQEQLQKLRKTRGSPKAHVTKKINKIRRLMSNPDNLSAIKDLLTELPDVLVEFRTATIIKFLTKTRFKTQMTTAKPSSYP